MPIHFLGWAYFEDLGGCLEHLAVDKLPNAIAFSSLREAKGTKFLISRFSEKEH